MKFSLALLIVAAFGAAQGGIITGPILSMVAVSKGANKIVKGVTAAGSAALGIGGSGSAGASASAAGSSSTGLSTAGASTGAASADASDEGSTSSGLGGLVGKVNGAISSAAGTVFDSAANVADKTTQTWNEGVEKLTETAQAPLEAGQTLIKEVQNKLDVIPVVGTLAKPLTIIGSGKLGLASSAIGALGNAEQGKMNLINGGLQGGFAAGKGIVNAATSLSTNVAGGLGGLVGKVNGAISSAAGTVFDLAANVADKTTQTWNEGVEKLTETAQAPLEAGQTLIKEVQNKLDVIPVVGTLAKPLTIIGSGKLGLASSAIGALGNAEQGKMNLINGGLQGGFAAGKGIVNAATSLSTNVAGGLLGAAGAKGSGGFGVKLFGR